MKRNFVVFKLINHFKMWKMARKYPNTNAKINIKNK